MTKYLQRGRELLGAVALTTLLGCGGSQEPQLPKRGLITYTFDQAAPANILNEGPPSVPAAQLPLITKLEAQLSQVNISSRRVPVLVHSGMPQYNHLIPFKDYVPPNDPIPEGKGMLVDPSFVQPAQQKNTQPLKDPIGLYIISQTPLPLEEKSNILNTLSNWSKYAKKAEAFRVHTKEDGTLGFDPIQ